MRVCALYGDGDARQVVTDYLKVLLLQVRQVESNRLPTRTLLG